MKQKPETSGEYWKRIEKERKQRRRANKKIYKRIKRLIPDKPKRKTTDKKGVK